MESNKGAYAVAGNDFSSIQHTVNQNAVNKVDFSHLNNQNPRGQQGDIGKILCKIVWIIILQPQVNDNVKEEINQHHKHSPNEVHGLIICASDAVPKHSDREDTKRYKQGYFRHF